MLLFRRINPRICCKFMVPTLCLLAATSALPATITAVGLPFAPFSNPGHSDATGINNGGQVVGYTILISLVATSTPFLYSNGSVTSILDSLDMRFAQPLAINSSGQIVGYDGYAFLISNGQSHDLNLIATPPAGFSLDSANAINDSGKIAGFMSPMVDCEPSCSSMHAFVESNGAVTDLTTLSGSSYTPQAALGLNNSGEVVGYGLDSNGNQEAFQYSNGSVTKLNFTSANAINSSGEIAGMSGSDAALYDNGQLTDLGNLGGLSQANALNDQGEVVGVSALSPQCVLLDNYDCPDEDAFLYSNGALIDLNSLLPPDSGWQLYDATGINDSGQIVGDGTLNGQAEGFLLDLSTATPEPGSGALTAAALGFLFALRIAARRPASRQNRP